MLSWLLQAETGRCGAAHRTTHNPQWPENNLMRTRTASRNRTTACPCPDQYGEVRHLHVCYMRHGVAQQGREPHGSACHDAHMRYDCLQSVGVNWTGCLFSLAIRSLADSLLYCQGMWLGSLCHLAAQWRSSDKAHLLLPLHARAICFQDFLLHHACMHHWALMYCRCWIQDVST